VGYVAHVKASEKTEVITLDIGADSSRRVVLAVLGDRATHPQPDEGEAYYYAPGNNKIAIRIKTADAGAASATTRNSGRAAGIHMDSADETISAKSTKSFSVEATEGINLKTNLHTLDGHVLIKGNLNVEHDLRFGGEGYKPSDGEWLAGGVAAVAALGVQVAEPAGGVADKVPLSRMIRIERGAVVVSGDLIVDGDLQVRGTVTATEFVKA